MTSERWAKPVSEPSPTKTSFSRALRRNSWVRIGEENQRESYENKLLVFDYYTLLLIFLSGQATKKLTPGAANKNPTLSDASTTPTVFLFLFSAVSDILFQRILFLPPVCILDTSAAALRNPFHQSTCVGPAL